MRNSLGICVLRCVWTNRLFRPGRRPTRSRWARRRSSISSRAGWAVIWRPAGYTMCVRHMAYRYGPAECWRPESAGRPILPWPLCRISPCPGIPRHRPGTTGRISPGRSFSKTGTFGYPPGRGSGSTRIRTPWPRRRPRRNGWVGEPDAAIIALHEPGVATVTRRAAGPECRPRDLPAPSPGAEGGPTLECAGRTGCPDDLQGDPPTRIIIHEFRQFPHTRHSCPWGQSTGQTLRSWGDTANYQRRSSPSRSSAEPRVGQADGTSQPSHDEVRGAAPGADGPYDRVTRSEEPRRVACPAHWCAS